MTEKEHADAVRAAVEALNKAIKAAVQECDLNVDLSTEEPAMFSSDGRRWPVRIGVEISKKL